MSDVVADLSGAKRRILERLKRVESATAPELAAEFGLTDTAIRQHLEALEAAELVERSTAPISGRGRPPVHWRLTPAATPLFADRHADLTVDLIASIRSALGDDALRAVVAARADRQLAGYRVAIGDAVALPERLERLAELRSAEGYLAEVVADDDALTLVEHHCPIQGAAGSCGDLCAAELRVFQEVLGPGIAVEREQHLLDGGQRCVYRVAPV